MVRYNDGIVLVPIHTSMIVFMTFDPTHTHTTSLVLILSASSIEIKMSVDVEHGRRAVPAAKIAESEGQCNHYDTVAYHTVRLVR